MSMKPGATMRPRASIVRAASPARSGPIAAMRSPSTATSAAIAGAPLPSTIVPCLMRSDHVIATTVPLLFLDDCYYSLFLDDLHRLHHIGGGLDGPLRTSPRIACAGGAGARTRNSRKCLRCLLSGRPYRGHRYSSTIFT